MTLRGRLLLAQIPLIVALLLIGGWCYRTIDVMDRASRDILKSNQRSVLAAEQMRDAADALVGVVFARGHGRDDGSAAARSQRAAFERELAFQEQNVTEPGEQVLTQRLRADWERLLMRVDRAMAAPPEAADELLWSSLAPALTALEQSTRELTAVNQEAMTRKSHLAQRRAESMSAAMLGLTLAACVIAVLASGILTTRLTRPLAALAAAVKRIGQGDLGARARLAGGDEIAQLAREFDTMADHLAEYRSSSLGELIRAQQTTQAAIDSMPDPVLVLGLKEGLLNANEAAIELFGVDPDAPAELAWRNTPPAVRELAERLRAHVAAGRGASSPRGLEDAVPIEVRGSERYFLARGTPVTGDRETVALSIVFQDVTRLRRFDELKTNLVATVAHELRTPLTSLRMALHLCTGGSMGPLPAPQAELLVAAREDCERLRDFVEELLDLSRIQAGRIELSLRSVSATLLLEDALGGHRSEARERGIQLDLGPQHTDREVRADPERIRLVLSNLITNAIRHTPPGGHVSLRAVPRGDQLAFEVRDTGAGISAEHLPRLFERFFRVPGSDEDGVGLGLFICKELIEAHGGRVGVESTAGAGSCFWFTLPLASDPPTT